jgi:putative heme-binding domain-containing protein
MLTEGWKGLSPGLKTQVLDTLLSRDAWQLKLLDGLEKKQVESAQVDAAHAQRLLSHQNESIRTRAKKLLATALNQDRLKVLKDYESITSLSGDRTRGKQAFTKTCSGCHQLDGVGHAVGPDLAALSNKSPLYLLQEILDPNRNVDSRYVEYQVRLNSGRALTGLLASESATSITLRAQEGKETVILRNEIDELRSSGKSLMPEGLEKELPLQSMADLIAYVSTVNTPPKEFKGNKPTLVKSADGKLTLLATTCEIHGEQIAFEADFKNIGFWHGLNDHVLWHIESAKPGTFDVYLDYACNEDSAGNLFVFETWKSAISGQIGSTGGWDKYQQRKVGTITLPAGPGTISIRPKGPALKGALMDLRGVYLVPEGTLP